MKQQYRIGSIILAALLLTACGEKEEEVKFTYSVAFSVKAPERFAAGGLRRHARGTGVRRHAAF